MKKSKIIQGHHFMNVVKCLLKLSNLTEYLCKKKSELLLFVKKKKYFFFKSKDTQ